MRNENKYKQLEFTGNILCKWLSEHWKNVITIAILIIFMIPIAIYIGFLFLPGKKVIEPGELLNYCGSSLIGFGTLLLSLCVVMRDRDKMVRDELDKQVETKIRTMYSIGIIVQSRQYYIKNISDKRVSHIVMLTEEYGIIDRIENLEPGMRQPIPMESKYEEIIVEYSNIYGDVLEQVFRFEDSSYRLIQSDWM